MKSGPAYFLAAALAVGGFSLLLPTGQAASAPKRALPMIATATDGRQLIIGAAAAPAIKVLEAVVKARNDAAYPAALAAAQRVATAPDEKYVVAKFRVEHGRNNGDAAEQAAALEAVLASGSASTAESGTLQSSLGILAFNAGNWQRAHDAFAKAVELNPADSDSLVNLALTDTKLGRSRDALPVLDRAIEAARAAGRPVPEAWLRNALQIAYESRSPDVPRRSREVLAAYPTAENWRNALSIYRDSVRSDDAASLDIRRLMRASRAMQGSVEYVEFAEDLIRASLPGEAKAVVEEAVRTGAAPASDPNVVKLMPYLEQRSRADHMALGKQEGAARAGADADLALKAADSFLGYGEYGKAAALYRAAVAKRGADPGLLNLRLGMALALSGDRPGAETALKAVTGPRADLAALWLTWLAMPR